MQNSIEVKNFTKKFGDFTAVDNISFSVEEGSIFAFLGPNGAGKSTTINALCTILEKTSGELLINGKSVDSQKSKVRNDIGIVFQESTLDGKLTIEENLALHCDFYNVPKSELKNRIDFALELVDLLDWKKAQVDSLSGGMKRRAEIARALVHLPKVLFLDEPTTGLDPHTRFKVWEYIRKLQRDNNITIFLTTHYMEEAEICNKVAIIDHGKIVAFDTPYNLKKQYTLTEIKIESDNVDYLVSLLESPDINFKIENNLLYIYLDNSSEVVKIISKFLNEKPELIKDIEISKGTLNDVFIAITGKEIRA